MDKKELLEKIDEYEKVLANAHHFAQYYAQREHWRGKTVPFYWCGSGSTSPWNWPERIADQIESLNISGIEPANGKFVSSKIKP